MLHEGNNFIRKDRRLVGRIIINGDQDLGTKDSCRISYFFTGI